MIYVGTAGWNIPRAHKAHFPDEGSQLQRYAARLNAAEINTSFYRSHDRRVYERWASEVPPGFRFSVKIPKVITHHQRLLRCREPLMRFLDEVAALGPTLGPLLLQLPPSFEFDARRVGRFLSLLRERHEGEVVCEPRHATWTATSAVRLLVKFQVARVAADPPRVKGLDVPSGWGGLAYYRWHGSPRAYFSPYTSERLRELARQVRPAAPGEPPGLRGEIPPDRNDTWCIFDNTGSGAAAANALEFKAFNTPDT